jgi:hypothetical protein
MRLNVEFDSNRRFDLSWLRRSQNCPLRRCGFSARVTAAAIQAKGERRTRLVKQSVIDAGHPAESCGASTRHPMDNYSEGAPS